MEEKIFEPKYTAKLYFGLLSIVLFDFLMLWQIISGKDSSPVTIIFAAFITLFIAVLPYVFMKRIVFKANAFTVEKFLWPTKTIEYTEVVDIGTARIKTKNGNLSLQAMMNSDELRNILTGLIKQGKISSYQIENKLVSQEKMSRKARTLAIIFSTVLWVVTTLIWPYRDSLFRDLILLVFFIPIYIVIYMVLKKTNS
jgi:hypothetical protein